MIDTHTHLFDPRFDDDRKVCVERAIASGVDHFVLPATDDDAHRLLLDMAAQYSHCCYATMGLHPTMVNDNPHWKEHLERVATYLKNPPMRFVAVGETGLDFHWSRDFVERQVEAFVRQMELSIEYDLPLILHVRDAWELIFDVMEPFRGRVRGVFHSFAGDREQVDKIERLGGFSYGINGTVTYKKSSLPAALEHISLDKIVLETDSPYLPPEPHRGQRNESAYIPLIAAKVAAIKGVTVDELDSITTLNAKKLFTI